jgi:HK97 family phage portal protein
MGFLDFLKRNKKQKEIRSIIQNYYGNNWEYFVWNYANNIYSIPEVKICVEKIADIMSTVPIYHKRINKDGSVEYIEDATTRVLTYQPNPLQNGTQFIKNLITDLLINGEAFAEPIFDNKTGYLSQIYPLPVKNKQFTLEGNNAFVQFYDGRNNPEKKYNLKSLIYLNRFSTLSGGDKSNLGLYETVLKSLGEKIVNFCSPKKPRAILQSTVSGAGALKERDRTGVMNDVKANFDESIQGLVYFDKAWQVTPINWQENDVNKELMQLVINIVYNYFGITEAIINGKATEFEMQMFIGTTIKALSIQLEREYTNKLYSFNEFNHGNRIEWDYHALTVTTMQSKTALFGVAIRQGILNIDECREMIGQPPLPNGWGKKYRVTADTVDIEIADKYQLGKVGKTNDINSNNAENIETKKEESNG